MTDVKFYPPLVSHPLRDAVLGEVHARPFHLVKSPRRMLHFAFMVDAAAAAKAVAALQVFCAAHNLPMPKDAARHHRVEFAQFVLRFELHAEFCTYTFGCDGESEAAFLPRSEDIMSFTQFLPQPGPHLVSVDLHLINGLKDDDLELEALFDPLSLAASKAANNKAIVATDFSMRDNGYVRILVADIGMTNYRAGALTQRLLEIETYRTLALLGLPEAHRLSPAVQDVEESLTRIVHSMTKTGGLASDRSLLDELTSLSAQLEADSASANFRFRASAAYDDIVAQRLIALGEDALKEHSSLRAFLSRRMAPAMRTCAMLQDRQAKLSEKLARATNLLRTRVDVEIEQQNQSVLTAMNNRARMQLRLQQTVEGLSVAGLSYYIVGLASYVFKGLKEVGWLPFDPGLATAVAVPVAVLGAAYVVRRIRNAHDVA